jgi:hypothetical protein
MTEPMIDPATGQPKAGNGGDPNPTVNMVQIPIEDYQKLTQRIDSFEQNYIHPQHQQQQQPATPAGPTLSEQLAAIDTDIDALDVQIDAAVANNQPISKLMKQRDTLTQKQTRMRIKAEDIDPAFATGIDTINQLTDTVTRSQMPHLSLVQRDYESALNSMPPDQRMNPKIRQAAYEIAVGKNIDKIISAENERKLRESQEPAQPAPTSNSRQSGAQQDTVPKPEEVLSKDTMKALRIKGQSVDEYYKSRGYEGWNDFWTKTGKDYFEG